MEHKLLASHLCDFIRVKRNDHSSLGIGFTGGGGSTVFALGISELFFQIFKVPSFIHPERQNCYYHEVQDLHLWTPQDTELFRWKMTEYVARNHAQFNRIKINYTSMLRLNTHYAITTEM